MPQASLAVYLRVKLKNILLEEAIKVLLFSEMLTQIFATKIFPKKLLQICVNFSFVHPKLLCKTSLSKQSSVLVIVDLKKLRKVKGW